MHHFHLTTIFMRNYLNTTNQHDHRGIYHQAHFSKSRVTRNHQESFSHIAQINVLVERRAARRRAAINLIPAPVLRNDCLHLLHLQTGD